MKIAILGGGITGLTASFYLSSKRHEIALYEKEVVLGGLASGFTRPNWQWPLERAYHHLFASDTDILSFSDEIGFKKIFFQEPITSSLYQSSDGPKIYPLDTPIDLLSFPLLSPIDKMRTAATLVFLKLSPFISHFENQSAVEFLQKTMGREVWNTMWEELFRKKFGKYAGNILASFIWARIKKRTKKLGYIEGGFQTFVDYLESINNKQGVKIKKGEGVGEILRKNNRFVVNGQEYDIVISTLPTILMKKITENIFSEAYLKKFEKLHYLHAVNLIIESKEPLLDKTYWLNMCDASIPIMVLAQHTNFINKSHYGGNHILYIGNYVDTDSNLLKMDKEEALAFFLPHLKKVGKINEQSIVDSNLFKAPWAQPIFDADFVANKPDFETPVKNFYIANLDMTYPYDRGTNYAVKLGKDVSCLV